MNRLVALACYLGVLVAGAQAGAEASDGPAQALERLAGRLNGLMSAKCLTPDAGQALTALIQTGRAQAVLSGDFNLGGGKVGAQQIEVEILDQAQHSYGITLALPGSRGGTPDAKGGKFLYYMNASPTPPDPRASAALLALAALFDDAIPESALGACGGGDEAHTDRRFPRVLALASAVAELAVVFAAILFGLYAVRPPGEALAGRDAAPQGSMR